VAAEAPSEPPGRVAGARTAPAATTPRDREAHARRGATEPDSALDEPADRGALRDLTREVTERVASAPASTMSDAPTSEEPVTSED